MSSSSTAVHGSSLDHSRCGQDARVQRGFRSGRGTGQGRRVNATWVTARWTSSSSVIARQIAADARLPYTDAARNQLRRVDQQSRADALVEAAVMQVANALAEFGQVTRQRHVDVRLVGDDLGFDLRRRVVELERDESLARARLQVLGDALVARVVRQDEQEIGVRRQDLAPLLDWQDAPVVRQRVDQHRRVLARLDDLVEVADRPVAHRPRQRAVHPHRVVALQQVPAHQVRSGQVLVARDRHQRLFDAGSRPGLVAPVEAVHHVFQEPGLAATGRPLEQHRQPCPVGGQEQLDLVADRQVERRLQGGRPRRRFQGLGHGQRTGLISSGRSRGRERSPSRSRRPRSGCSR